MPIFHSQIATTTENFIQNRQTMLALIEKTGQLENRAAQASAKAKPRDGIRLAREVVAKLNWPSNLAISTPRPTFREPRYDPDEIAGVVPLDYRQPYDVKEVIARLVDDSDLLEFKGRYGSQTVCVQATIHGYPCAFIGNNGPIDTDGATKTTHFIQLRTMSRAA